MWLQGRVAARRVEQNNAGVELGIAHVQSSVPVLLQKYLGLGMNWMWEGLGAGGCVFVLWIEGIVLMASVALAYVVMGHNLLCQKSHLCSKEFTV